jgi:hypothetical protein
MLTDKLDVRVKIKNLTFFCMLAKTQTIIGITSLRSDSKHIVMWDLEKCTLEQAENSLLKVQKKYCLSDIYITSDAENSFRAWCLKHVNFKTFLKILLDTDYLDANFFDYTVKRKKATLRTGNKKGRPTQRVVSVLKSYPYPLSTDKSIVEKVVYDTGIKKRGISLIIGED